MLKNIITGIFGGGGKALETIATEWIETDLEKAEAKTLMLKVLDPNGMMRRELSRRVAALYTIYLITTLLLLCIEFFSSGTIAVSAVTEKVTDLFMPITTLFGVIVSASFGVNYVNTKAGV